MCIRDRSFIEFEADFRPNATLYRVKEAKSFYPFTSIPYDPVSYTHLDTGFSFYTLLES